MISPELIVVDLGEVLINGAKHLPQRTSSFCHRYGELHNLAKGGRGVTLIFDSSVTSWLDEWRQDTTSTSQLTVRYATV